MMELCTTLIVASHFVGASYSSIVGVQPQLRDYYRQGPTFKCVSGTGEISWDRLNDEVCDCSDGSDEPGAFGMPKCRMCTEGDCPKVALCNDRLEPKSRSFRRTEKFHIDLSCGASIFTYSVHGPCVSCRDICMLQWGVLLRK